MRGRESGEVGRVLRAALVRAEDAQAETEARLDAARAALYAARHALDAVPGLGPARRTDLVKHFGSVKKITEATKEEIQQVKGVGPKLAESIYEHLHRD